ncbi:MAG TPA: hypothetical protein VGN57_15760 [Pirellulaceae bacterium]|jgi:hypothetical protein|nr:hypothetical protein [Pirellulaceae bacterium]
MLTRSFASCLLAASAAFAAVAAPAPVRAHGGDHDDKGTATKSLVKLVDLVVKDVDVVSGKLVANAELTLDVSGRKLIRTVELPMEVTATPDPMGGTCDILNLSIGPIWLDVLGLMVRLDDCNGGPITVDIGADPAGGFLGELLCSIAGGMVDGGDLQTIFDSLEVEAQVSFKLMIEFALSEALGGSLIDCKVVGNDGGKMHAAAKKPKQPRRVCPLLSLEIPNGVQLNLLGLTVETSGICLDVWAKRGQGNLLGNLLCGLTELLDQPGNRVGQIRKLTRRIQSAVMDQRELSL